MRRRRAERAGPDTARIDATARAVIGCAADPIIALGKDRAVWLWNPAAEAMFGWTAAEVIGLEPPVIPRELRAEHNAVLERAANGSPVCLATRRLRKDGELLDLRIDTSALRGAAGEFLGWISVCQHSEDDAAVRRHMAERARLVRRLGDVVADMNAELDTDLMLDRIAASLRELTRADAGGFLLIEGDRVRLTSLAGLPEGLRGQTADLAGSMVGDLIRSGKSVLMAKAGAGGPLDRLWSSLEGLHTITLSVSHVAGRPYGALYALYSGRNVGHSELELLELLAGHASVALSNATAFAEVVRQRAHERAVIDASADGIAVLDGGGLVRQWNPAAQDLTGVPAERAIGRHPSFPLPEPGCKLTHRLASGRWIDVLCTALAGHDERVIDFRDITQAKQLEEAKDLFLATTSHELRTPITVVQGFARTLASRWDSMAEADRRSAVQAIADRSAALAKLVDQLLLGSRAGSPRLPVGNSPFDLAGALRQAAAGFQQVSDKHVLTADIPEQLPAACGDAVATDVIIGQLLENAIKYSPDGGPVTVTARPAGDTIEVTVSDHGIGIPAADRERVFERFAQADAGDRRRFGGIGLGLFIVRELARAQGGDVSAAERPGGGTVMRLRLPCAPTANGTGRPAGKGTASQGTASLGSGSKGAGSKGAGGSQAAGSKGAGRRDAGSSGANGITHVNGVRKRGSAGPGPVPPRPRQPGDDAPGPAG